MKFDFNFQNLFYLLASFVLLIVVLNLVSGMTKSSDASNASDAKTDSADTAATEPSIIVERPFVMGAQGPSMSPWWRPFWPDWLSRPYPGYRPYPPYRPPHPHHPHHRPRHPHHKKH